MNLLILTFLVLTIIFAIGWIASIKIKNASIVDAMWALSLGIPVFIYISSLEGSSDRKIILLAMALIWSLRLGSHLAKRIYSHHPKEDPRYKDMRDQWGEHANRNFLLIFLTNSTLVFLLSLPFYFSSQLDTPIQWLEWIGLSIFIIGLIGETISDQQLAKFRSQRGGEICKIGLWNYSRHPNYFFEAVIWLGIYLFCCNAPSGIYTIHAPLIMIFLLTKVTGIPPLERSLLESRGDAYRQYQQTTSAFIPWFKSKNKTS
jgi:steroid 5-alpha reductase family enzyme